LRSIAEPAATLPRDPERIAVSRPGRLVVYFLVGVLGAAWGAVLMAMDAGVEGHGHGGGGTPFAMLPHQILLSLPLAVLVVVLLRDARGSRMAEAMVAASLGIVALDLALL
jgi:hypothetical protein